MTAAALTVVAERSLVDRVAGLEACGHVCSVPRERHRGRWAPLAADAVVDVLEAAGQGAVVLARPAAADPDTCALPGLARIMRREVVLLPASIDRAAWVLAMAAHLEGGDRDGGLRALQALAGMAAVRPETAASPTPRPAVLLRWALRGWRPCRRCGGGGHAGALCGRCGTHIEPAAERRAA